MYRVVQKVTGDTQKTVQVLNEQADLTQHECYQAAVNHYKHNCFNWHKQEVDLSDRQRLMTGSNTQTTRLVLL